MGMPQQRPVDRFCQLPFEVGQRAAMVDQNQQRCGSKRQIFAVRQRQQHENITPVQRIDH